MSGDITTRRPDSELAREAEDLVRVVAPPFLTNHSFRSHFFAVALAERDRMRFDEELLYVASLLHDTGLLEEFDTGKCFEEDGADVAKQLAVSGGWTEERAEAVAEAIRLHTAVEIALEDGAEAFLLWHSTGLDVTGHRHDELERGTVDAVLAAYPRLDFKEGFTHLVAAQAERKSGCWADRAIAAGLRERIVAAPFES